MGAGWARANFSCGNTKSEKRPKWLQDMPGLQLGSGVVAMPSTMEKEGVVDEQFSFSFKSATGICEVWTKLFGNIQQHVRWCHLLPAARRWSVVKNHQTSKAKASFGQICSSWLRCFLRILKRLTLPSGFSFCCALVEGCSSQVRLPHPDFTWFHRCHPGLPGTSHSIQNRYE